MPYPKSKAIQIGSWRYYAHWSNPAIGHCCGPRGGCRDAMYLKKKTEVTECVTCGAPVPEQLRMILRLERLRE